MDIGSIAVAAGALLVWALLSARLGRLDVTGPMALVVLGAVADATGLVSISPRDAHLDTVAGAALALVLFSDASRIDVARLRRHLGLPGRLLGIGLPASLLLGAAVAYLLWPDDGWGPALLVAACLAPTDAGLGSVIVTDPTIPRPIRRALNVESGLNDGIASPVVLVAIALTLAEERTSGDFVTTALSQLGIGLVVGIAVGAGLGLALAADFRVASPEARFVANFVKLAFHAGFGISMMLPRLIGEQKASLMLLTGRRIKGEEALEWGLADQLVPAEELRAAALALANEIAEGAPLAIVATRMTLRGDLGEAIRRSTAEEYRIQSVLNKTEDFAEGVKAVAERRPGNFKGR